MSLIAINKYIKFSTRNTFTKRAQYAFARSNRNICCSTLFLKPRLEHEDHMPSLAFKEYTLKCLPSTCTSPTTTAAGLVTTKTAGERLLCPFLVNVMILMEQLLFGARPSSWTLFIPTSTTRSVKGSDVAVVTRYRTLYATTSNGILYGNSVHVTKMELLLRGMAATFPGGLGPSSFDNITTRSMLNSLCNEQMKK